MFRSPAQIKKDILPRLRSKLKRRAIFGAIFYGTLISTAYIIFSKYENTTNLSYFIGVTFSTLGYGDITPITGVGRIMSIALSVGGLFFPAFLVHIVDLYSEYRRYRNLLSGLDSLPELKARAEDLLKEIEKLEREDEE